MVILYFFYNRTILFLSPNKEFGKPHVLRSSLRSDIFFKTDREKAGSAGE